MNFGEAFLKIKQVQQLTSLSRTSIQGLVAAGEFPQPVPVTERRRAFLASEVEAWLQSRVAIRDAANI